jgi:hypothetical protein
MTDVSGASLPSVVFTGIVCIMFHNCTNKDSDSDSDWPGLLFPVNLESIIENYLSTMLVNGIINTFQFLKTKQKSYTY